MKAVNQMFNTKGPEIPTTQNDNKKTENVKKKNYPKNRSGPSPFINNSLTATSDINTVNTETPPSSDANRPLYSNIAKKNLTPSSNIPVTTTTERSTRTRTNRSVLVGKGVSLKDCPVKAAARTTKHKEYHATNLDVDTNENELCQYLKGFAPNVLVEKLVPRHPDRYSSFKITVPPEEADQILDADIWPSNVLINHFFPSWKLLKEQQ